MPCYRIDNITPVVAATAYIAPTAVIIGDVLIGENVYIAPGACLRGDFGRIVVEDGANIQDHCVMHGFPQTDTIVEEHGHIGHAAILHGCRVSKNAMIGINAVVLDNAVIEESAIVAAGAVVPANTVIPPRTLCAGIPAKVRRTLTDDELKWKAQGTDAYQHLCRRALDKTGGMMETAPLRQAEANRPRIEDIYPQLADIAPKKPSR